MISFSEDKTAPSGLKWYEKSRPLVYAAAIGLGVLVFWGVFALQSSLFIGFFDIRLMFVPTVIGATIGALLARQYLLRREISSTTSELRTASAANFTLLDSKAVLIDALEAIGEGFVLYGPDGRLVVCNSIFRSFYRYSESEAAPGAHRKILGKLDVDRKIVLLDSPGNADFYMNRREDHQAGPPESFIVQLADGRTLLVNDRQTTTGSIVSIQRDITDLKKVEHELIEALDLAESSNRVKSEFLANMSHELRTPLNAIIGFSQMINDEAFGPINEPRYKGYISDINVSGEHLLSIINDILDLSRIEAGLSKIEEQEVGLHSTVEWCLAFVQHRADKSGVELENHVDRHLKLSADLRLIRQILINLLSNSVKFTQQGGVCRISGSLEPDNHIRLTVIDSGIGMSESDIPIALERFGQLNDETIQEGTGLGLPLAKSLTELHGGTFEIRSEKGEGTSVTLDFPSSRTLEYSAR